MIKETIDMLGRRAKDKVTGFSGTITSAAFDLYGCVQVLITPDMGKDGKVEFGNFFDINRVELVGKSRAMPVPDFDKTDKPKDYAHGPADKPFGMLRLPSRR